MNKNKLLQEQNTHIDKCDQSIQRAVTHRERERERQIKKRHCEEDRERKRETRAKREK